MKIPRETAIATLQVIGVTVGCALLTALFVYDAVHRRGGTQPLSVFAATIFAALTLRLLITPWITTNYNRIIPVVRHRIYTEDGYEPAFRFIELPSAEETWVIAGLIILFTGMALFVQALRPGSEDWVGIVTSGKPILVAIVFLVGAAVFISAFLRKRPGRGGITLTPTGVLWAEPTEPTIFTLWMGIESVELLHTSPRELKKGAIPAVGVRLYDLSVLKDLGESTRQRLQENRDQHGCELIFPQTQLASPVAEAQLAVEHYLGQTERRSLIGSQEEYDHLSDWIDSKIAQQTRRPQSDIFDAQ